MSFSLFDTVKILAGPNKNYCGNIVDTFANDHLVEIDKGAGVKITVWAEGKNLELISKDNIKDELERVESFKEEIKNELELLFRLKIQGFTHDLSHKEIKTLQSTLNGILS